MIAKVVMIYYGILNYHFKQELSTNDKKALEIIRALI
jgi:hypothetical protein